MHGLLTLIDLTRRPLGILISLSFLLPVFLGLDISGNDEDGGGSGADFLLVRGSGSCDGNLLRAVDSGIEPV